MYGLLPLKCITASNDKADLDVKVLLDSCISPKTRDALLEQGYDVVWVGDWEYDPGDETILAQAHEENRVVVTLDKDFGTLAILKNLLHSGIIRLVGLSVTRQADICHYVLEQYSQELVAGAIVTAEEDRVRIRPAN